MVCRTFDELIRTGFDEFKNLTGVYEKIDGKYIGRTFGEFYNDVRSMAEKLIDMGLQDKTILLYGKNSYNWMAVYMAVIAYVGIIVPLDKEWKANEIKNVLSDTKVDCIFYSDYLQKNLHDANVPKFNLENEASDLISQGRGLNKKRKEHQENSDRICSIMFTSGTTSAPKKIALSERNLVANGKELEKLISISTDDRYMLSLPLSHIGPVLASFVYPISMGASLYIPNDFAEMAEDVKLIRPTVFYGVPRIFEKMWEVIPQEKKRKIEKGIRISNFLRRLGIDKRKKIFAEFHKGLGGAVRFAYSGSVKLDDGLVKLYNDMGLTILQAYGMTESSAVISFDSIYDYRLCSAGKVLPNIICKIIEQNAEGAGEICVKGDNIATGSVADDGYLHTGDLGYIDKDGYLFIVGRKKRMIKLSNAKNVYPDEIEKMLMQNNEIQQAIIYEKNGRISAKIISSCRVEVINKFIDELNETLPGYMRIHNVSVVKFDE